MKHDQATLNAEAQGGACPRNLQGIWNGARKPAWDSKFTTNINLQKICYPVTSAIKHVGRLIKAPLNALKPSAKGRSYP